MQNNRNSRSSARLLATLAMLLACAVVLTFIGTMLAKQNSAYNAPVIEGVFRPEFLQPVPDGRLRLRWSPAAAAAASVHLDVPVIGQNPDCPTAARSPA